MNASRSEVELLERELALLRQAAEITRRSFERCSRIGVKEDYDGDELDVFEAFASRFGRLADILVQRVFRLIERIDASRPPTGWSACSSTASGPAPR